MDLSFQDILKNLLPTGGSIVYDIFLYPIFFLSLVALFMQSDKQLLPTLLLASVLMMTVIAKLSINASIPFERPEIAMLFLNLGIFIFPALVAPMTKAKRSRGLVILVAVFAFVYAFLFWFIEQR